MSCSNCGILLRFKDFLGNCLTPCNAGGLDSLGGVARRSASGVLINARSGFGGGCTGTFNGLVDDTSSAAGGVGVEASASLLG